MVTAQYLRGHPVTLAAVLQSLLAPLVVMLSLFVCVGAFGQPLESAYLILGMLAFSFFFPSKIPPYHSQKIEIAIGILWRWVMIVGVLLLLGWVTKTLGYFDPRIMLAWLIATPLVLFAVNLLFPAILPLVNAAEGQQRVAIIAGRGQLARQLASGIETSPFLGIRIAGYFDDRNTERNSIQIDEQTLGTLDQLADYVKSHPVDLIYITLPMASQPRILKLLDDLRDTTVSIYFMPDIFLADLIQARLDTVAGMPVIAVCETPLYGISGPLKRGSDMLLASLILLLIAPLMLFIALAIKWESAGPVIFKQRRYGLDGREIIVYKFRSMSVAEDGDNIKQATRNDSRVTPLGAFLRRTSLDELPQFINVLQGKMSIVGPRPHAVAHNELYRKLINGYMIRHKVRPGITGWAQVNGLRGETDTLDKMQKRVEFDLAYLRNWSLRWDLEIVFRTLLVAWKKDNAY